MQSFWNQTNEFKISDFQKQISDVKFDLTNTNYHFIDKIGTGAYGIVCHAKNLNNNIDYAIKKIRNPFNHKITLTRTLREIKILNHFNHNNIINIVDMFIQELNDGKDIYVVFDLMESDLHKIIISKQLLSDDHIRYFMYQIFCGLNYIHSASVIHRDLKPANILINSNCHLKIADFGMARCLTKSIKFETKFPENSINFNLTQYVMTRWYRAPELLMGQFSYNTKIDLWSCGCILAELYLKYPLFRGDNMINQLKEIIRKMGTPSNEFRIKVLPIVNSLIDAEGQLKPVVLNELVPSTPKKVIDLLSHLLVYDPNVRWSAAQSLKHIFFIKYKNPIKEEICNSVLTLSPETELSTSDLLKESLLKEISSMRSKQIKKEYNSSCILNRNSNEIDNEENLISNKTQNQACKVESPKSERTLSAESERECDPSVHFFYHKEPCADSSFKSDHFDQTRLKTVSQFTKNKIIDSIQNSKGKSNKKVITAAQRQKERKDRKLKRKSKRDVKFKTLQVESMATQEHLSELDKSFLKKWEHVTNNIPYKEYNVNACEDISLHANTWKYQNIEVDEMSAGLSALLLFDDLMENEKFTDGLKFPTNFHSDEMHANNVSIPSTEQFDLLLDEDIDCIDLDMNILETFSLDLIKNELKSNFN